ncbi:DUF771 domain-containing protein [Macrococcus equipercicus]|uniref:DUF771 domain-containing protein n=1 Tax=Macrococcus equipercicus TaxID=69967 RepID=A0ABQ6RBB8_9STAP|nr:DUF771 domain-containing protein [Macrococcus equipercicus]KAA1042476.1 DUF771 domain-containing protein [Macrococcus equipercicus]
MQTLQAQIQIPPEFVLISKVEYEELLNNTLDGKFLSLKEVAEHIGCSTAYLKNEILYHPRYKEEIEKWCHFPTSSGDHYRFHAKSLYQFLDRESVKLFLKKKY